MVNDPVDMAALRGRGVDGRITDGPTRAREVLAERADAGFAEKPLLHLAPALRKPPPRGRHEAAPASTIRPVRPPAPFLTKKSREPLARLPAGSVSGFYKTGPTN